MKDKLALLVVVAATLAVSSVIGRALYILLNAFTESFKQ